MLIMWINSIAGADRQSKTQVGKGSEVMQRRRQKQWAGAIAAILAVAVAMTGTYAWQSISQKAKNVVVSEGNPGGRLHDDFDGSHKAVYVENFTDEETGGLDLFIRVRLDEYLEIGEDAGKNIGDPQREAEALVAGTDIGDEATWVTHIPGNASDPFHTYWRWNLGGSTVYMPTFNKDQDSLEADINGTFEGPDGDPTTDADRYGDYHEYQIGETETDTAVYAAGGSSTATTEVHTAKATQTAVVLTMQQWKDRGCPIGAFWVWDTDGWAYWADKLEPGEATGLLLSGIRRRESPGEKMYYAIHVVAQFCTDGDWGAPADGDTPASGFYDPDNGAPMSDNALALLKQAMELIVGADGEKYKDYGDNTFQQYLPDGTFGSYICGGEDQTVGTADDRSDVVVIDPPNQSYGSKFLPAENGAYWSMGLDGLLGTADDIKVWGDPWPTVIGSSPAITLTTVDDGSVTNGDVTMTFSADVSLNGNAANDQTVEWQVSGNTSANTGIDASGLLTVGADEAALSLTVTATSPVFGVTAKKDVAVPWGKRIEAITAGSTDTVYIDGIEWYVLVKDTTDNKALLWSKEPTETRTFGSSNTWRDSALRTYLNGDWLNGTTVLKGKVVETDITTRSQYNASTWITTSDKVFLLSEADMFGTSNGTATTNALNYTYGNTVLVPDINMRKSSATCWLRSPRGDSSCVAGVSSEGKVPDSYSTTRGVRPALWFSLEE